MHIHSTLLSALHLTSFRGQTSLALLSIKAHVPKIHVSQELAFSCFAPTILSLSPRRKPLVPWDPLPLATLCSCPVFCLQSIKHLYFEILQYSSHCGLGGGFRMYVSVPADTLACLSSCLLCLHQSPWINPRALYQCKLAYFLNLQHQYHSWWPYWLALPSIFFSFLFPSLPCFL